MTGIVGDNICEQSACLPNPCQNGGRCQLNEESAGGYECSCRSGYTGEDCSLDIDECLDGKRASHWSYCWLTILFGTSVHVCVYLFMFQGEKNSCCLCLLHPITDPCNNGGSCVNDVGGFECGCAPGTSGHLCQYINACDAPNITCPEGTKISLCNHLHSLSHTAWTELILIPQKLKQPL